MTHHEGTFNFIGTVVLSAGAGAAAWLADPELWKAIGVAAVCGLVGGVARWAGHEMAKRIHARRNKSK